MLRKILIILLILVPAVIFTACSDTDDFENDSSVNIGNAGNTENEGEGGSGNNGSDDTEAKPEEEKDPRIEAYILKIDGKDVAYLTEESELDELKRLLEEENQLTKELLIPHIDKEIPWQSSG